MASQYSFNVMPSVSISRSRFKRKSQHKTAFNLGKIIPIYVDEVLPGDTRSIDMASIVRMSTPIAPIMDNIYLDFFAFFVPNRLVWDHWKEFMGENNEGAGIPSREYTVPQLLVANGHNAEVGCYADYFGLPANHNSHDFLGVSALPFRGLAKIYNRWFRNQNVIAPLAVRTDDTAGVLIDDEDHEYDQFVFASSRLLNASKLPDYFTKALPYAQKGQAVQLPLGTTAPIVVKATSASGGVSTSAFNIGRTSSVPSILGLDQTDTVGIGNSSTAVGNRAPLYADLSVATAATINQLRYAFQLQKFLEKDALYGSRYWEVLASHFGITAPDASLQDPEYLGGQRMRINIDQVLSMSGYSDDQEQNVGKTGANSVSGFKGSLFTKSFTEHGWIYILAVARHDQTYCQGINRMFTRKTRYDYYWPVFANLGAQEIKNKEIYLLGDSNDDGIFGYQEAWAEYRFKPSITTGLMSPAVPNSLNYWTLTNEFGDLPTLGKVFIEQSRDNIQRALVTGDTGPDFIADFYFEDIAVRPMPMFSIPGLIDHH